MRELTESSKLTIYLLKFIKTSLSPSFETKVKENNFRLLISLNEFQPDSVFRLQVESRFGNLNRNFGFAVRCHVVL